LRLSAAVKHYYSRIPQLFSCLRPWSASNGLNGKTQERHLYAGRVSSVS
jgi:hypothetical protein